MAIFQNGDEVRLDWSLLFDGPVTKYFSTEHLEQSLHWLHRQEYKIIDLDCSRFVTTTKMLKQIGERLEFPDYFQGDNLDGFDDFLYSINIPENSGLAIVLRRYDQVIELESQRGWQILDILARHSRRYLMTGKRLVIILQSSNPELHVEPLGAQLVSWNQGERFDFQRGIGSPPDWWVYG